MRTDETRRDVLRTGALAGMGISALALPGAAAAASGFSFPSPTASGALDSSLPNLSINGSVKAVAVDADDGILIGGEFTLVAGSTRNGMARVLADGTLDPWFNPNMNNHVDGITIDDSGRILVTGRFTTVGGTSRTAVARLLADGTLDTSFGDPGLSAPATGILEGHSAIVQPGTGGRILVVGNIASAASSPDYSGIVRLTDAGQIDTTFRPIVSNDRGYGVAVLPDGNIAFGGYFGQLTQDGVTSQVIRFALLEGDGTLITPVPTGFQGSVYRVQVDDGGRIVVAGSFNQYYLSTAIAKIARMADDGSRDVTYTGATFDFDGSTNPASVQSMLALSGGRTLVGGYFNGVDGQARSHLALLRADGTLDTSFADIGVGGSSRNVWAIAVDRSGRVIIGGAFDSVGGATPILRAKLARLI